RLRAVVCGKGAAERGAGECRQRRGGRRWGGVCPGDRERPAPRGANGVVVCQPVPGVAGVNEAGVLRGRDALADTRGAQGDRGVPGGGPAVIAVGRRPGRPGGSQTGGGGVRLDGAVAPSAGGRSGDPDDGGTPVLGGRAGLEAGQRTAGG